VNVRDITRKHFLLNVPANEFRKLAKTLQGCVQEFGVYDSCCTSMLSTTLLCFQILCCQEIQEQHYTEFFCPEMEKLGN